MVLFGKTNGGCGYVGSLHIGLNAGAWKQLHRRQRRTDPAEVIKTLKKHNHASYY
jgi:hypothetical protein